MSTQFDEVNPHPADDGLEQIHERAYVVRAYRRSPTQMVLRGALRDQKPPYQYIPDDPEPLTIHHMLIELEIAVPSLEITAAKVDFEVYPHSSCPAITVHYGRLVGVSVGRGYTNKIRELFGGPRGCTHTTALLLAMGPVAVQSLWSFRHMAAAERSDRPVKPGMFEHEDDVRELLSANLNTCHVWADDGPLATTLREHQRFETPLWLTKRRGELDQGEAGRPGVTPG